MRSAPPAACEVALDAGAAALLALLLLTAAGSGLLWFSAHLAWVASSWSGLGCLVLVWPLARLLMNRSRVVSRRLVWDGSAWSLLSQTGRAAMGRPLLVLDAGAWLLVRWQPAEPAPHAWRGKAWLPLARTLSPGDWHALRTALIWAAR